MMDQGGTEARFFIIKAIRIYVGFKTINVASMMEVFKKLERKRLERLIEEDGLVSCDQRSLEDRSKITNLIYVNFILKTFFLVVKIYTIIYFLGILYLLFAIW